MASSAATTCPFTVGDIVLIRDIVLIDAKESYMTSILGKMYDSFLELITLLGKIN